MKLFTCTDHDGFWPVGVASVIIAPNKKRAQELLDAELLERNLMTFAQQEEPYELIEVPLNKSKAIILCDGNY